MEVSELSAEILNETCMVLQVPDEDHRTVFFAKRSGVVFLCQTSIWGQFSFGPPLISIAVYEIRIETFDNAQLLEVCMSDYHSRGIVFHLTGREEMEIGLDIGFCFVHQMNLKYYIQQRNNVRHFSAARTRCVGLLFICYRLLVQVPALNSKCRATVYSAR